MTAPRLTRTYLAVPAHRVKMVQGAAASAADAVFMDLEDAVPPAEKATALAAAAAALAEQDWGQKTVTVRLNAIDSPSIQEEIKRLGRISRLDAVIIPKAETVADVAQISRWISDAAGARVGPVEVELLIETLMPKLLSELPSEAVSRDCCVQFVPFLRNTQAAPGE